MIREESTYRRIRLNLSVDLTRRYMGQSSSLSNHAEKVFVHSSRRCLLAWRRHASEQ